MVNRVYGQRLADTGVGRPVTQCLQLYGSPSSWVRLYDYPGIETENAQQWRDTLGRQLNELQGDENKRVHVVWYFVTMGPSRWQDNDDRNCRFLKRRQLPVIIVLLHADNSSSQDIAEMKRTIKHSLGAETPVFSSSMGLRAPSECPRCQSDELATIARSRIWRCTTCGHSGPWSRLNDEVRGLEQATYDELTKIDPNLGDMFVAAQVVDLKRKIPMLTGIILSAAISAGVTGAAVVVPLVEIPAIAGIQSGMLVSLGVATGVPLERYPWLLVSYAGMQLLTGLAALGLPELLKFIPGLGTVAGGAISASVGPVLTVAMGVLYSVALFKVRQQMNDNEEGVLSEAAVNQIMASVVSTQNIKRLFVKVKNLNRAEFKQEHRGIVASLIGSEIDP
jgi:uncharacterized protein (DUF697 family)